MIYIASKTKHAHKWCELKEKGYPINSTWIYESKVGETSDFHDLWHRCLTESASCDILIVYKEPEDILKGAWIEVGSALSNNKKVFAVGIEEFTIAKYKNITHFKTIEDAFNAALKELHFDRHNKN
jgi:hypothetical protein